MSKKDLYTYRTINQTTLALSSLDDFDRFQQSKAIYVFTKQTKLIENGHFISDWDLNKKREVVVELNALIEQGGSVEVVYHNEKIVAFAALSMTFFGSKNQYLELNVIQVSRPYRNLGIGSKLMIKIKNQAKLKGAQKIYISGHPAVESVLFYEKMGAKPATEINEKIALAEPDDLQLEIDLD